MWPFLCFLITCGLFVNVQLFDTALKTVIADSRTAIVTNRGPVRGYEKDGVLQFFDIPYGTFSADRPFQEPTEPAKWTVTREINDHRSRCPQISAEGAYIGDTECLTLSIFKSYSTSHGQNRENENNEEKSDVLFHIHDSSFSHGSGDPLIYGPKNLVSKGVILVLPNYRLGPLGFMCLQNRTAPGNAALKDLSLALKWTKENIEAFGGNSSNIVVSGSGAGGALVEFLTLSNMSKLYISKVITESGFSVAPWALDRNPLDTASSLLQNIEKDETEDGNGVFDRVDLKALMRGAVDLNFRPCIEKESGFITDTPWKILQNGTFPLTFMSGSANRAAMERALRHTEETLSQINSDLSLLLPNDLIFENKNDQARIGRQVKTLYFGEKNNITLANIDQLSQCYTDSEYLNPGIRSARLLIRGGATVYFYEFSFHNSTSDRAVNGSAQGDSLTFVFGGQTTDDEQDIQMRNTMTDIWVSFIKTGRPSAENIVWNEMREMEPAEEVWLSIGATIQMEKGVHVDRLSVWQEIYNNYFVENNSGFVHKPIYILACCVSVLVRLITS